MTSPQERINEKLKETESIIKEAQKELDTFEVPGYLKELQLASFEKRLDKVQSEKTEIEKLNGKEELVLTMYPDDLPSGQISVRDFTLIVGGLQDLSDSIANTLYNQPSEKGKIPNEILDMNEMVLKETLAGSFKAVLNIKHPEQTEFDEPEVIQTIKELFSLFASSSDEDLLAEKVSILGPRAFKYYTNWTKSIAELETPVEIEWSSAFRERSTISLDKNKAEKIYLTLNNFSDAKEEDISLKGTLTGANIRTKTFEFFSEEGERISGRISKDAIAEFINPNFQKTYAVDLLKVIVTGPGFKEKVSWTLKSLTMV